MIISYPQTKHKTFETSTIPLQKRDIAIQLISRHNDRLTPQLQDYFNVFPAQAPIIKACFGRRSPFPPKEFLIAQPLKSPPKNGILSIRVSELVECKILRRIYCARAW